MPAVPSCGATLPLSSLRPLLHRRRLRLPPVCSQDRQRSAPTEGNLSAGRPARNKPVEPPTKLARGNNGSGGASSGSRLPPHVSHSKKNKTHPEEAEQAADAFRRQFAEHKIPEDIPTAILGAEPIVHLPALLVDHLGVASRGEARRLIIGGAVRLDGETVEEIDLPREALVGRVLQRGRRDFVRLITG